MASGDVLFQGFPQGAEFPAANYATLDTRNNHPCLDYDATTAEEAFWTFVMPDNYAAGGLTVEIFHAASTATSGTVAWSGRLERIGDRQQDVDSDGFASAQVSTPDTVSGTSGQTDKVTLSFTDGAQMDSIAAGELCRIGIARDVANDSAAGDAELYGFQITET